MVRLLLLSLFFFSFLLFFSILTHWKWFQEQLYALRHAWYCEKSPIIIIIIFDDDGGDLIRSIFFWVGVFQAIFFQLIIIANVFLFYVFVNYCLSFSWEWANKKILSFEWYACMVIAPYFIHTLTSTCPMLIKRNETNRNEHILTQIILYWLTYFFPSSSFSFFPSICSSLSWLQQHPKKNVCDY